MKRSFCSKTVDLRALDCTRENGAEWSGSAALTWRWEAMLDRRQGGSGRLPLRLRIANSGHGHSKGCLVTSCRGRPWICVSLGCCSSLGIYVGPRNCWETDWGIRGDLLRQGEVSLYVREEAMEWPLQSRTSWGSQWEIGGAYWDSRSWEEVESTRSWPIVLENIEWA